MFVSQDKADLWVLCKSGVTHLLVVVVVGVDVVVVLLVSHVLLIAQLAVEAGVSFLLRRQGEGGWTERRKRRKCYCYLDFI